MKTTLKVLTCSVFLLGTIAPALAAGYLKFEGIDGEAKDKSHKKWSTIQSVQWVTAKPGQILIGLTEDGQEIPLTEDGRYHTDDGKMIIIVNGKISRVVTPGTGPRGGVAPAKLPAVQKQKVKPQADSKSSPSEPGETRGLRPQPEPPGKSARSLLTPGETRGLRPQPEPPGKSATPLLTPGETRGLRPQPEPPGKPETQTNL